MDIKATSSSYKWKKKKIKLREDHLLLSRFLVIQQSRPQFVPRLPDTIGNYELAVIPRSLFAIDGSLLIPTDKSSIMHAIEAMPCQSTDNAFCELGKIDVSENSVHIIDTMAQLQSRHEERSLYENISTLQDGICQTNKPNAKRLCRRENNI